MADQVISLIAAGMILLAYGALQTGKMRNQDLSYILLNLIGSLILAVVAVRVRQWGLTALETVWALISLAALRHRLQHPAEH